MQYLDRPELRLTGIARPSRRSFFRGAAAATGLLVLMENNHFLAQGFPLCALTEAIPRSNDDVSKLVIDERRIVYTSKDEFIRTEPAFGNHHLIVSPTRAQLQELGTKDLPDIPPDQLFNLGLRNALLQTREDVRLPGYGRMWTMKLIGVDEKGQRRWAWGADHVTNVAFPEFSAKFPGCEEEQPAHLFRLYKIEKNRDGGFRLEFNGEIISAVNCTDFQLRTTTKTVEEEQISRPPTPTPVPTPTVTIPRPQVPAPPGEGAPQVPKPKAEMIVVSESVLADSNPYVLSQ